MIPCEIAELAALICPHWADLDDDASNEVLASAQRIWNAGWRSGESVETGN